MLRRNAVIAANPVANDELLRPHTATRPSTVNAQAGSSLRQENSALAAEV